MKEFEEYVMNEVSRRFNMRTMKLTHKYASVDFILYDKVLPEARCICEIKSRMDERYSLNNIKSSAMITKDKIDNGVLMSQLLGLPFIVFYYFPAEKKCFSLRVTDGEGNLLIKYTVKSFQTQQNNTNKGKKIIRQNVMLDLTQGKELW